MRFEDMLPLPPEILARQLDAIKRIAEILESRKSAIMADVRVALETATEAVAANLVAGGPAMEPTDWGERSVDVSDFGIPVDRIAVTTGAAETVVYLPATFGAMLGDILVEIAREYDRNPEEFINRGTRFAMQTNTYSKLDREKLLEAGVTADQIQAGTITTETRFAVARKIKPRVRS